MDALAVAVWAAVFSQAAATLRAVAASVSWSLRGVGGYGALAGLWLLAFRWRLGAYCDVLERLDERPSPMRRPAPESLRGRSWRASHEHSRVRRAFTRNVPPVRDDWMPRRAG